ncbi:MAG TPA: DUF2914 domain-containing protein [Gammaproteobacteria bacterium]|jgi:uncharacterized iron-regulated membrane protein|nr:DUF2914 domain-containing protein [Gammaproteobacteria bacterium]
MQKINKIALTLLAFGLFSLAGSALAANAPAAASTAAAAAPAAPAAAAAPAAEEKKAAPAAKGSVNKAQFTSAVTNHEPTDDLKTLDNSHTQIFFYAVLNNLQDQEVTFRWTYNGVTQAEVKQTPKYPHYRTYTSKQLDASKLGTWTVDVLDSSGATLATKTFDYTKADAAAAAPSAAPAAATK